MVCVRRAIQPSTASRARAGTVNPIRSGTEIGVVKDVATSAVMSPTSVERTAVAAFAGPNRAVPLRRNPLVRKAFEHDKVEESGAPPGDRERAEPADRGQADGADDDRPERSEVNLLHCAVSFSLHGYHS